MRTLLAFFVAAFLLAGCPSDEPARVTVALFDTSGSTDAEQLRARYAALADRLVRTAAPGDRLVGDRISAHSRAQAHLAIDADLPRPGMSNPLLFEAEMDALRDSLRAQARAVLDAPPAPCTDLLGAFDLAGRLLRSSDAAAGKRLVLASDMVHTCGDVNFRRADLSEEGIAALIEAERTTGRLPDLTGITVWVAGAGTDTTLAPLRRTQIERFWQAYFAAAGADLAPERYAPTLLDWE